MRLVRDAKTRVREIDISEARKRLEANPNIRFIDVREDHEWQEAHAAGAEHIGRGVIERDIERLIPDKNAELILYFGGESGTITAADNLQRMGYTNVLSTDGGWKAWRDAGFPVEPIN